MTVQVTGIPPNALFIQSDYPLWKEYVSEENSNAKITRSTQTQLQRQFKYSKNQCWQHPKYLEIGRAAENNLAATGGLG